MIRVLRVSGWLVGLAALAAGCGTVELGENIVQPNTQLSEDYFYCFIEPHVIEPLSCANGATGDVGGCHTAQSSLRLLPPVAGSVAPTCTGDMSRASSVHLSPGAVVPPDYIENFQRVQFTLGPDAESSEFYRRPTGMDSHPRVVVTRGSAEETLILNWFGSAL